MPVGLILNHNDPTESFVLFHSDEYNIPEALKLAGTTKWMGTHMDLKVEVSRVEMVLIIEKLLEDMALE